MINLILCGGSGKRLWPISRRLMPKQFVQMFHGRSLFQETVLRNQQLSDSLMVVSNKDQYFLALDQIEELERNRESRFLLEPMGRNTAPAVALACMLLEEHEVVLVTPSDHKIRDEKKYAEVVEKAKAAASSGSLVTFGIEPAYPEIGYGYIEREGELGEDTYVVRSFHEKPDNQKAKEYLQTDRYYWNSGIFCFQAGVFLSELRKYSPEIYQACDDARNGLKTGGVARITEEAMAAIPEESIDYAVMEKSNRVRVVPADIGWNDLGSFDALYDEMEKDEEGNAVEACEGPTPILIDSKNNLIVGGERQIATVDIDGCIIVETGDALLIAQKGSAQKVNSVVAALKDSGSELHNIHLTVHRPWGTYTILEESSCYKIKRIVVGPNKRLSLQKHYHRNEHWIVVSGTARVQVGDEELLVRANESTYISMGTVHRLDNPGKIDLVLIEVQVGEYVAENDIIRIEDDFERS